MDPAKAPGVVSRCSFLMPAVQSAWADKISPITIKTIAPDPFNFLTPLIFPCVPQID